MSLRRTLERCGSRIALAGLAILVLCCALGCASRSPAAESAARIPFDPAFAEAYEKASEAVGDNADDVKLLAVQSSTFSQAHFAPSWTFLFCSWQRVSAYTVEVVDGEARVVDNPGVSFTQDLFEAAPDDLEVVVDADEAYGIVLGTIDGEGTYLTCRAYLMTFVPEGEDSADDEMVWFFSFNETDDLKEISIDPDENLAPAATYGVDARTGDVRKIS